MSTLNKRQNLRIGYVGASANPQFDYDHRADNALYLDKKFIERKLGVMRTAYEKWKQLAAWHAGPAVVETFGEAPFVPEAKETACCLSEKQEKLMVSFANESAQLTNPVHHRQRAELYNYCLPAAGDRSAVRGDLQRDGEDQYTGLHDVP